MIILSFIIFVILILFSINLTLTESFESKKRNCFIVISKDVTENMYNSYSNVIKTNLVFISDKKPNLNYDNIIYYDSKIVKDAGFTNLHSKVNVTSWDKALFYISKSNLFQKYDYVWIIEDDCYINKKLFNNFIQSYDNKTEDLIIFGWYKSIKEKWDLWSLNKINNNNTIFENKNLRASINQICRLSPKLVEELFKIREKYNSFRCHELLLASIVEENNLKILKENNPKIKISALGSIYSGKTIKELEDDNIIAVHPKKNWFS